MVTFWGSPDFNSSARSVRCRSVGPRTGRMLSGQSQKAMAICLDHGWGELSFILLPSITYKTKEMHEGNSVNTKGFFFILLFKGVKVAFVCKHKYVHTRAHAHTSPLEWLEGSIRPEKTMRSGWGRILVAPKILPTQKCCRNNSPQAALPLARNHFMRNINFIKKIAELGKRSLT